MQGGAGRLRGARMGARRQQEVEAGGGRGSTRRRHASAYWQGWVASGTGRVGRASTSKAQVGFSLSLFF